MIARLPRRTLACAAALVLVLLPAGSPAQQLVPGRVEQLAFTEPQLPATLYGLMTGGDPTPVLSLRLPDDYDAARAYPLLVYVPGFHGNRSGNIENARTIAGARGWVVASLPLFKAAVDPTEVSNGLLVGFRGAAPAPARPEPAGNVTLSSADPFPHNGVPDPK